MNIEKNDKSDNGILFIFISLSVFSATLVSFIIDLTVDLFFIDIIVWIVCFFIYFIIFKSKIIHSLQIIRNRIRKSTGWSPGIKLINGLCWAAPFGLGAIIPSYHEYLILTGIGLGNLSTFIIFMINNKIKNMEQFIVGLISLMSIGIIILLYNDNIITKSSGDFLARILISVAYGIGGIYSSIVKAK
ncbi:MAG TPA: hypothetical protein VFU79_00340 [Nitrososphaeraceae archaeon]|nr:hypothetical protein [Nitrososphaeraceae archaeon]